MNAARRITTWTFLLALLIFSSSSHGESITYQGRLNQSGAPFTGLVDIEFRLFDQMTGGSQIGSTLTRPGWPVEDGLFQAELDFGSGVFTGEVRWLEIVVDGIVLAPRQAVRPAPMALFALAGNEGAPGDSHWQLNGTATFYNDGNVGIGTDSPSGLLELVTDSSVSAPTIRLVEQGNDFNRIFFMNQAVADRRWSVAARLDDSNPLLDRFNIFHTSEGDLITASGNGSVGIGQSDPIGGWRLDVNGGAFIRRNSSISQAHLDLFETESDFARINFRTQGESGLWALAGRVDNSNPGTNIFNIFNSVSGNLMSILGSGEIGVGTTTPDASMEIRSRDQWNPDVGTGRGDFYVGDGSVGLSIGIALGGGGRGHSRIWSKGGVEALFLGTAGVGTVLSIGPGAIGTGAVGVETNSPQNTLHVNGGTRIGSMAHGEAGLRTVRVDGAGDLTADRPVRHFTIPAAGFSPNEDGVGFDKTVFFFVNAAASSFTQAMAPVHLPDAATVTEVTARVVDDEAAIDLRFQMCGQPLDNNVGTCLLMADFQSSGASPDLRSFSDTSVGFQTIDNGNTAYFMRVTPVDGSWTDNDLSIVAVRITYLEP